MWHLKNIFGRLLRRNTVETKDYCRGKNSPFDVPHLFYYWDRSSVSVGEEVAELIKTLMLKTKPDEWGRMYEGFRYLGLQLKDVSHFARFKPDVATELLGVASLCSDGHVRERAIKELGKIGGARAFPYVLLRLSDWVSNVREAAHGALVLLLSRGLAPELLAFIPLIERLQHVQRVSLKADYELILSALRAPNSRPSILECMRSGNPLTKLFCYRLVLEVLADHPAWIQQAVTDHDLAVRIWAALFVVRNRPTGYMHFLRTLLNDRSPQVRALVIRHMDEATAHELKEVILALVFSENHTVRVSARYLLGRLGMSDFHVHYRESLSRRGFDGCQAGGIAGLGETGESSDYELVRPFLEHPSARIRSAALDALSRLDRMRSVPFLIKALYDRSGIVRYVAIRALPEIPATEWKTDVLRLMTQVPSPNESAAFRVLTSLGGWHDIPGLLKGVASSSEALRVKAWTRLDSWHKKYGVYGWCKPDHFLMEEINVELPRVKSLQPPEFARHSWEGLLKWIGAVEKESAI